MRTKTIYCTLDTETVGGCCRPKGIYNVGGVIHDNEGTIVASINILIAEWFKEIQNDNYAKKNFSRYQEMIDNGETTMVATENEAIELLSNLLDLYNVKYVMCYNTGFDLIRTKCSELIKDKEFIDIYKMADEIIAPKKSYQKYCDKHNFKTKQGNCKCNVETVYGYLTDNPTFAEEHTAFSDAKQEMEIFVKCRKAHKPYTKNYHKQNDFSAKPLDN